MNKIFFLVFTIVSYINTIEPISSKYWLTSCSLTQCNQVFSLCLTCNGELGCKQCITNINQQCSTCADDIYDKNDLETIGGNQYFMCDSTDIIQVKACHLYCRGQYFQSGECVRIQNIPVCQCSINNQTTNPPPVHNFNGTLKLNISITDRYQRVFAMPNGDLIRGSSGNTIQIWDIQNGIVKRSLTSSYLNPTVFDLLSNGDLIAGYRGSKTILIWDLDLGSSEPLKRIFKIDESFICLKALKNNDLAIGQDYGPNFDIVIRDSQNGQVKMRLVGHTNWVSDIIILPNENLVSCSHDGTVKIWNPAENSSLKSILHSSPVCSITLLNNGNLASGLLDGKIEIRNFETGDLIRVLIGHEYRICYHNCLHDNGYLLSGSWDDTFKVWNPNDGSVLMTSKQHKDFIIGTTFLANGDFLTATNYEICIWK